MRVTYLLIGCLALILGSCSKKGGVHAPAPPNKELLRGKWKNESPAHFLTNYDFNEDGTVKMAFVGVKQPVTGRYTWSGERTVDVDYPKEAEVQHEYEKAAKAYKHDVETKIENKKLSDRAGPSMLGIVPDKLPEKETLTVSITDPKFLILIREDNTTLKFNKVD
jgi:hypothetical protein